MSARAPFVPRPASRADPSAQSHPPSPFRPNGLLGPPDAASEGPHNANSSANSSSVPPFKPLNLSGLPKVKHSPHSVPSSRSNKPRPSYDASRRSPKPFMPIQHKHLVSAPALPDFLPAPKPSPGVFMSPPPNPPNAENHEFNSSQTHILSPPLVPTLGGHIDAQEKPVMSAPQYDPLRFLGPSPAAHRARSASHPVLASINEDDEDVHSSPHKVQGTPRSSVVDSCGGFAGGYAENFSELPPHMDDRGSRVDARKRMAEGESDYKCEVDAKRYKSAAQQVRSSPVHS